MIPNDLTQKRLKLRSSNLVHIVILRHPKACILDSKGQLRPWAGKLTLWASDVGLQLVTGMEPNSNQRTELEPTSLERTELQSWVAQIRIRLANTFVFKPVIS